MKRASHLVPRTGDSALRPSGHSRARSPPSSLRGARTLGDIPEVELWDVRWRNGWVGPLTGLVKDKPSPVGGQNTHTHTPHRNKTRSRYIPVVVLKTATLMYRPIFWFSRAQKSCTSSRECIQLYVRKRICAETLPRRSYSLCKVHFWDLLVVLKADTSKFPVDHTNSYVEFLAGATFYMSRNFTR